MKRLILNIVFLILAVSAKAQLVPLQSQYMFNGVALNPAYTGSEDAFSVVGTARAQWLAFPGAPTTQALTVHAPLKKMKAAFGGQVYADQIGVTRRTGIFGSYAYRLQLERSMLSFGISAGVNLIRTYFSELGVNDQGDATLMSDSPLGVLPNASFGVHYYGEKFFLSFSTPQFLTNRFDGTKYRLSNDFSNYNWILGGGYLFKLKNDIEIKPSVLAKFRTDSPFQMDINVMAKLNEIVEIGSSYRTQEALIFLTKLNAGKQLSFMYSFGIPLNPLFRSSFGSHELSIKYNFFYETPITSPRFLGY